MDSVDLYLKRQLYISKIYEYYKKSGPTNLQINWPAMSNF